MTIINDRSQDLGVALSCGALDVPHTSYYRHIREPKVKSPCSAPACALLKSEKIHVLDIVHSPQFVDKAPAEIVATLLDEGRYLCSTRTMYRILEAKKEVRECRNQFRHRTYTNPELLAIGPKQVWSWGITKLKGPVKWMYYNLYVMLAIYSRYVAGWLVAEQESADLGKRLIEETCEKQQIEPHRLVIHSDRGSAMTTHTTAQLLGSLGITKSHSRPHVSNDNPYSESQFKTLKYSATFPGDFGSLQDSREYLSGFFDWYNNQHRHSGVGMMTPQSVHYGFAYSFRDQYRIFLRQAYRHIRNDLLTEYQLQKEFQPVPGLTIPKNENKMLGKLTWTTVSFYLTCSAKSKIRKRKFGCGSAALEMGSTKKLIITSISLVLMKITIMLPKNWTGV